MPKWVKFEHTGTTKSGITKIWHVLTIDSYITLGYIKWYSKWRKYCFFPTAETIFEEDCLRDIANFCEQETFFHKRPEPSVELCIAITRECKQCGSTHCECANID